MTSPYQKAPCHPRCVFLAEPPKTPSSKEPRGGPDGGASGRQREGDEAPAEGTGEDGGDEGRTTT